MSDNQSLHSVKVFVKRYDKLPETNGASKMINLEDLSAEISRFTNSGWRITYVSTTFSEGVLICLFVIEIGPLMIKGSMPDLNSIPSWDNRR